MAGETSTAPAGGDINRGPSFLAILWATLAISIIFVFARVYVRLVVIKYHGWDDYWIIASIVSTFNLFLTKVAMKINSRCESRSWA